MKDYYDIYYLANRFDFDGATLTKALKKTFEDRRHVFTVGQFEQVIGFVNDEAMQKKWNAFCRKIDTDTEDYGIVLRKINNFLAKPFMAAVTDNDLTEHWISSVNEWRKKGVSYG